ncbi:PREDICTED: methyl-CpG-binding domain-containing protein 6-like isoform X2 [Ipomoea nil]|uniref:methyl-CpG-binding domain-containing protein 6-like isoform X2 n=1 Tax=Ipomoea nil TaxID=35883 RepID=UPI000900BDC8|nr:PREDICTED: methyl-CpG-binding domain-containing protein 6-like isoform X2 [Ipomoea nil]
MESSNSSTALALPNSMSVPLQTPPPHFRRRHSPPSSFPSGRFMLPTGWGIQEVPRSTASNVDRYYFEPGTGRKFRSLREVERHLNGGEYTPRSREFTSTNPLSRKMTVSGGKLLRVDEGDLNMEHWAVVPSANTATSSRYQLPDGWIVEEVPRRDGSSVDKYYYEPGTGQKFRSIIEVEKHLAEFGEHHHIPLLSESHQVLNQNRLLSNNFKPNQQHYSKNTAASKRNIPGEVKKQASPFVAPPSKIKWVLASPRGNAWNPFLAETPVPDSVKQQWNNRFMLFVNNEATA